MGESCVEAAIALNIPFIVSSTADYTEGKFIVILNPQETNVNII